MITGDSRASEALRNRCAARTSRAVMQQNKPPPKNSTTTASMAPGIVAACARNRYQAGPTERLRGIPGERQSPGTAAGPEGLIPNLLIRSRISAATAAFAGVRTAGRAHSARPQPSPRVRRRTPALLSELLSIDQASTGEHDRPMALSIEGMLDSAARGGFVRSSSVLPTRAMGSGCATSPPAFPRGSGASGATGDDPN